MSILQEPPRPPLPVICDFFFEQTGPPGIATYDGDIFPYPPLPSDKGNDYRYAWGTTPVFLPVEFFGTAHTVEGKIQPHVIPPPEISILEYFWDFGDGHTGYGPIVTHTYQVADPTISISLTVLDSLGREFSTSKALSLVIVDFGFVYSRIRGHNTENTPKRQEVEVLDDFSLTVEGSPMPVVVSHGGKKVRELSEQAVSNDQALILTHFYRSSIDLCLTQDSPERFHEFFRDAIDSSVATDTAKCQMQRFAISLDESWALEGGAQGSFYRPLLGKLLSSGSIPSKLTLSLQATMSSQPKIDTKIIAHILTSQLSFAKQARISITAGLAGRLTSTAKAISNAVIKLQAQLTSKAPFAPPRTYEVLEVLGAPKYESLESKFATYGALEGPQIKE